MLDAECSTGKSNLDGVKSIQWGIEHEKDAIKVYEEATGNTVAPCGLILSECGRLGASPDGVVGDVILEVKCPYSARSSSISDMCKTGKSYLQHHEQVYYLRTDHDYYHQIQGQMYLSGKEVCHFVVWSPTETVILPIAKDPTWETNLSILAAFFDTMLLPRLLEKYSVTTSSGSNTNDVDVNATHYLPCTSTATDGAAFTESPDMSLETAVLIQEVTAQP